MIIYNNELQFKFEFHHYWSIFDRVVALGLRIFMKISVFRIFFKSILQILKWNLVWYFTAMSYRSSLSFVIIDQYLTESWPLDSDVKFASVCILVLFWGRHLVLCKKFSKRNIQEQIEVHTNIISSCYIFVIKWLRSDIADLESEKLHIHILHLTQMMSFIM
jgi:hypothetical protein